MLLLGRLKLTLKQIWYRVANLSLRDLPNVVSLDRLAQLIKLSTPRHLSCRSQPQTPSFFNKALFSAAGAVEASVISYGSILLDAGSSLLTATFGYFHELFKQMYGDGAMYLRGLFFVFAADALIIDDEPL